MHTVAPIQVTGAIPDEPSSPAAFTVRRSVCPIYFKSSSGTSGVIAGAPQHGTLLSRSLACGLSVREREGHASRHAAASSLLAPSWHRVCRQVLLQQPHRLQRVLRRLGLPGSRQWAEVHRRCVPDLWLHHVCVLERPGTFGVQDRPAQQQRRQLTVCRESYLHCGPTPSLPPALPLPPPSLLAPLAPLSPLPPLPPLPATTSWHVLASERVPPAHQPLQSCSSSTNAVRCTNGLCCNGNSCENSCGTKDCCPLRLTCSGTPVVQRM